MKVIYKKPEIEVIVPEFKWTILEKSGDGVLPDPLANQNINFDEEESSESENSGLWDN